MQHILTTGEGHLLTVEIRETGLLPTDLLQSIGQGYNALKNSAADFW
jgi:hypothetical protein